MKYSFHSVCNRLHENKKYANAYTILLVDIFLSVMSSFITLLFADSFIIDLSRLTYGVIIGGSCVAGFLGTEGEPEYHPARHDKEHWENGICNFPKRTPVGRNDPRVRFSTVRATPFCLCRD